MSSGRADQRRRRADQPANERAEACCAAMTFEEKVAVFDGASGEWVIYQGRRYEVLVGRSSRDTRGRAGFEVGTRTPVGP